MPSILDVEVVRVEVAKNLKNYSNYPTLTTRWSPKILFMLEEFKVQGSEIYVLRHICAALVVSVYNSGKGG